MKTYTVEYTLTHHAGIQTIDVKANNKEDAYDTAVFDDIPQKEGTHPYSAWVSSVTYSTGKVKYFNTCEGNPY